MSLLKKNTSSLLLEMYIVASHVISHLSATSFPTYATHNIIYPLGLSFTTYNVFEADQERKLSDAFVNMSRDQEKWEFDADSRSLNFMRLLV
jgi:hypothetical protein